ncbi:MAG: ABC transporter ATP-binding protein [Anaerolineae bacterium]
MIARIQEAPPLVVENLSFRYRDRTAYALRQVSFQVGAGEILLIAGASGCGKTTLLRCINGLIPRSYKGELQGRIRLYGQETRDMSMAHISQTVGTVLQDPERQIVGSYVLNEVAFGLENLGLPREEIMRRVDGTLRHLGIAHLRERETFHLSGGEKQKVAIAGTLAMEPSILLLDEPLANLDPASAQEALRFLRRLAEEGKTIVIVEHRVEDVLKIEPHKVLYLVEGRTRYWGDAAGLAGAVDYHEVKLPAEMVMAQARAERSAELTPRPPPTAVPALAPGGKKEPLVEFRDVHFAYNGKPALQDVSLAIYPGDVVAILGPNGAGKTTLVKHAIGLLKARRGQVIIGGREARQASTAQLARTVGYVFQSPAHMLFAPTVREELAFGPRNLGYDEPTIEEGVAQAVRIVNLSGLEEYPPLALSFGQQKRVTIAAILAMRSRILAMDEPTAGQDYKNYMTFMDAILRLPYFEAILFITHDLDLAICYANRVVLLNEGRVVADGPPAEVLSQPHLLEACHLLPTSLLRCNLELLPRTGRFMRAEALAHVNQA